MALLVSSALLSMDGLYIWLNKVSIPKSIDSYLQSSKNDRIVIGIGAAAGAMVTILTVNSMFGTDPLGRSAAMLRKFLVQEKSRNIKVNDWIDEYNNLHDDKKTGGVDGRNSAYTTLVNAYYELATIFYEWGWGQSFHFAYQLKHENFQTAIARLA